jgi:hypothetical protein
LPWREIGLADVGGKNLVGILAGPVQEVKRRKKSAVAMFELHGQLIPLLSR